MRHLDKRILRVLKGMSKPWELVKKRDHYFVLVGGRRICVGSNSSKPSDKLTAKTIAELRKADEQSV